MYLNMVVMTAPLRRWAYSEYICMKLKCMYIYFYQIKKMVWFRGFFDRLINFEGESTVSTLYRRVIHQSVVVGLMLVSPALTSAQEARTDGTVIEEIVVTAQKRSESINDVGMSIEASTGEQLQDLGITDAFDLYKVVSGFSSNVNYAGTAIYTIRGGRFSGKFSSYQSNGERLS